jgi:hypothetical protein
MARYISSTAELSYLLEKIINESSEFVLLITPYLRIHHRLKKVIENKILFDKILIGIITKKIENNDEFNWINNIIPPNQIFLHHNLHAKCYLNENQAIVTSLNLYEYSMINNIEFGFEISKTTDHENYSNIFKAASELIDKKEFWLNNFKSYKCIDLEKLVEIKKFTTVHLVLGNDGQERVRLSSLTDTLFIDISSSIVLKNSGIEKLKELVNNYSVYEISTLNGIKYLFGEKQNDK